MGLKTSKTLIEATEILKLGGGGVEAIITLDANDVSTCKVGLLFFLFIVCCVQVISLLVVFQVDILEHAFEEQN